jgi:ribosomal protein S4
MGTRRLFAFKHCKRVAAPLWSQLTPRQSVLLAKLQKTLRRRKQSSFGTRLRLRRFVCLIYGNLSATAFRRSAARAAQESTLFGQSLLARMERRLDVACFRAGFAKSILHARQGIGHGHFTVNGQGVYLPSFILTDGDIFGCTPEVSHDSAATQESGGNLLTNTHPQASHLEVSHTVRTAVFLFSPQSIFLPSFLDPKDLATLAP